MRHQISVAGQRFGRLVAGSRRGEYVECVCDCGVSTLVRLDRLKSGKTKSCGCYARELKNQARADKAQRVAEKTARAVEHVRAKRAARIQHAREHEHEDRLRTVWNSMMQRCYNPNDKSFARYGARGITVHPSWHMFDTFYTDMRDAYTPGLWLERNENDEGYAPGNCTFVTPFAQAVNRCTTLYLVHPSGVEVPLAEVVRKYGLPYSLAYRVFRRLSDTGTVDMVLFLSQETILEALAA